MNTPINLLPYKVVQQRVGKARSWIRLEWLAGRFPKPVAIGRSTMFVESEIDAWLESKISNRKAD